MVETFFLWLAAALGAVARLGGVLQGGTPPLALALFAAGWLLGATHPDGAWRRALALGLSVPLAHAVARLTHSVLPYATPSFAIACLAVIPAALGTLVGVASRRVWTGASGDARRG